MLRNLNHHPENYAQEYRKAFLELEREHHKFLGVMDVVKALLMWIETTDERVRKNLARQVVQA